MMQSEFLNIIFFLSACNLLFVCVSLISCILQSFVGHGDSINEIRTQTLKPSLIVSASKVSGILICFLFLSLSYLKWSKK